MHYSLLDSLRGSWSSSEKLFNPVSVAAADSINRAWKKGAGHSETGSVLSAAYLGSCMPRCNEARSQINFHKSHSRKSLLMFKQGKTDCRNALEVYKDWLAIVFYT